MTGSSHGRPGWRQWPLRRRLVAIVLLLVTAVTLTTGLLSTLALRESLLGRLDSEVAAATDRIGEVLSPRARGGPDPSRGPPQSLDAPGQRIGTLTMATLDGTTRSGYLDSTGTRQGLSEEQEAQLAEVSQDARPHTVDLTELGRYRVLARTGPGERMVVLTGLPMAEVDDTLRRYVVSQVAVALAGLVVAGLGGLVVVRRQMRPLERVAATASRVSTLPLTSGEVVLAERVPAQDTDPATEAGQVGAALNGLLDHVEEALGARHRSETQVRQFVADASHELRTPLASIRGYAELVRRRPGSLPDDVQQALGRVESEAQRMTSLVEDLLLLARLDTGRPLERAEVDVAALAVNAVADAHAAGPEHRWLLELPEPDVSDATVVLGDPDRLHQLVINLLTNARVHTPPGTTVTTTVQSSDTEVILQVADDGPGIPDGVRERLFDRFARADAGRSRTTGSTGLGLAIARAIAQAHGGTVEVASAPGRTTFTVTMRTTAQL